MSFQVLKACSIVYKNLKNPKSVKVQPWTPLKITKFSNSDSPLLFTMPHDTLKCYFALNDCTKNCRKCESPTFIWSKESCTTPLLNFFNYKGSNQNCSVICVKLYLTSNLTLSTLVPREDDRQNFLTFFKKFLKFTFLLPYLDSARKMHPNKYKQAEYWFSGFWNNPVYLDKVNIQLFTPKFQCEQYYKLPFLAKDVTYKHEYVQSEENFRSPRNHCNRLQYLPGSNYISVFLAKINNLYAKEKTA